MVDFEVIRTHRNCFTASQPFGWIWVGFGLDLGSKLGGKLDPSLDQNREKNAHETKPAK